jgi:predicted ATP-binding protein involved in virulence
MQWIYTILKRVRILCKPTIIQRYKRRESLLTWSRKRISGSFDSADRLSERIFRLFDAGELDELNSVCQRVGLGENISVRKFFSNRERSEIEEYVFSVEVDGVNIGLLSDGTIRVLSILMEVIFSKHGEVIIIEEPETHIHPAMLAKLLNEIETYTYGQNLIVSTHSPQVVAWTSPEKINLVHRKDGKTFVHKLGEAQIHNVIEYLSEEGDLGEWIYSGILDDE